MRWLASVPALALAGALGACAGLPAYTPSVQSQAIRLAGARHELSYRQSERILARLEAEGKSDVLSRHLAFMEAVSDVPLTVGNEARLLIDGPATYQAMFRAIDRARDHINLETYILRGDELGERLAQRLMARRAQGVTVNVLYDAVGSMNTQKEFFERLRQAGVTLCEFNPINPITGLRLNQRDHRKIMVVDGTVAFTGGINFDSVYSNGSASAPRRKPQDARHITSTDDVRWRDTQIEIRGPAVAQLQRLFLDSWDKQRCAQAADRAYFPPLAPKGDKVIRVIGSSPDAQDSLIYLALVSAISRAERSVDLTMAYFVPDAQMLRAVTAAVRRGVAVRLIVPGFSDSELVLRAGQHNYEALLRAGVRIYERHDAMLHAKTAVIDGVWSTVGSANMDMRSFLHNDEVNAEVLGAEFGRQMLAMFERDLARATPVELDTWVQRPVSARVKEWVGQLLRYWL